MKWKEWDIIAKNEQLWDSYEEKGLLKAVHINDFVLQLWFEDDFDVSIYELDFYPLIMKDDPGEVFLFLKNKENFKDVKGNYALIWKKPNQAFSVDIAPECVRYFCEKYGRVIKGTPKKILSRLRN